MTRRMFPYTCIPCAVVALALTGCVDQAYVTGSPAAIKDRQAISAGYTGCPAEQNEISDSKTEPGLNVLTWNATCNGKVYLCTGRYTNSGLTPMSCAPRIP